MIRTRQNHFDQAINAPLVGAHIQIIACAGSGKTETLARRVAHLLVKDVASGSIVASSVDHRSWDWQIVSRACEDALVGRLCVSEVWRAVARLLRTEAALPVYGLSSADVGSGRNHLPQIAHAADQVVPRDAARDGARDGVEAAERALSQGFALLAPAGEDAAVGARQREIAERLGEGEETRTLADWLQGQPPADDARGLKLDRHIAELEAREGEAAARPYAERAQRLASEPSPPRRQLLADSLLVELAALAATRREAEKSLSTLTCLVAELEQVAGSAEKAILDRAQDASGGRMAGRRKT